MQPIPNATDLTANDAETLRDLYAYPDTVNRSWVRVNFISSIDGGVSIDNSSGGLGTPIDRTVFTVLRELADVVLVGAGTVRAEDYRGVRTDETQRAWRSEHGLAAVPPIAIVSMSADIDPAARLFTDTSVAPIVLTCASAPSERKQRLVDAGATVLAPASGSPLEPASGSLSSAAIIGALAELGLHRVLCEGGPRLFGQLLADEAVDELCLTTAPMLIGGTSSRIAVSANAMRTPMTRRLLLGADDGTVLSRWVRADREQP